MDQLTARLASLKEHLTEASRVLSAANLSLVEEIGKQALAAPHHPASAEILAMVKELIDRHNAAMGVQEAQAPAPADPAATGDADEAPVCGECGARLAEGDRECGNCGAPVEPGDDTVTEQVGRLIEAVGTGPKGSRWSVVLIESGRSINGNYWSPRLLESPAFLALVEGLEIYEDHDPDEEQAKYPVRRVGDLVGVIAKGSVRAVREGQEVRVEADIVVLSEDWRKTLVNAREADELGRFQFSINARGTAPVRNVGGQRVAVVEAVNQIRSFDLVTRASAGGRFIALREAAERAAEAQQEEDTTVTQEELIAALRAALPEVLADLGVVPAEPVEEAAAPEAPATEPATPAAPAPAAVAVAEPAATEPTIVTEAQALLQAVRDETAAIRAERAAAEQERLIEAQLRQANLPERFEALARARLTELGGRRAICEADVTGIIQEHQEVASAYSRRPATGMGRITESTNGRELFAWRLEATLMGGRHQRLQEASPSGATGYQVKPVVDREGKIIQPFTSLREAYCAFDDNADPWAGDLGERIYYAIADAGKYHSTRSHKRIQESITTAQFGEVAQAAMHNALLRHYEALPYDDWRQVCSEIGSATDFRTMHFTRVGGYTTDLDELGENEAYQPFASSPSDEEVTFGVTKRGKLEDTITLEMIANDDIGGLQRIPQRLAEVAKRTLYKFVLNSLIMSNPTMGYDSVALFDAAHSNTNTLTPSVSAMNAVEQAMQAFAPRLASADVLGPTNSPRIVLMHRNLFGIWSRILNPSDAYAYGLTPAATTPGANVDTDANLDPHMFKGRGIVPLVNWFAAATTNWVAIADPNARDTVIVRFFAGRQEPELFIQDDPNSGSGFERDAQALKIRHIYGGVTADHTAFYRGNV